MRAIYYYRDGGNDFFVIMKRGECIWDSRRSTAYNKTTNIKIGECYDIEYTENKDPSSKREREGGNYFTIITNRHNSTFEERKQNIFEAMKIIIDEFYTTKVELKDTYEIKKNVFFAENGYVFDIYMGFQAIAKLYRQEKLLNISKIVNEYYKKVNLEATKIFERKDGETDTSLQCIEYVKRVKKRDFGFFTSKEKVIKHIHKLIQNFAKKSYNDLIDELQDKTLQHFKYPEMENN